MEVPRCADATLIKKISREINDVTLFSEVKNANILRFDEQTSLEMFGHEHLTLF